MEKIIFEKVGARLKQARELRHITLEEAGKKVDVHKSTVLRWENGETEKIKFPVIEILSNYYNVNPVWLMGYDVPMEKEIKQDSNAFPTVDVPQKYPVLGKISAGLPILAVENIEGYMYAPSSKIQAGYDYFFLRVIGDSMNLKFPDGCLLLVQKQPELENSQIGVIRVNGDDATVKRFKQEGDLVILEPMSSNPEHQVQIYNPKKIKVEIIGKVICAITDVN